jgi:hypothetical protein
MGCGTQMATLHLKQRRKRRRYGPSSKPHALTTVDGRCRVARTIREFAHEPWVVVVPIYDATKQSVSKVSRMLVRPHCLPALAQRLVHLSASSRGGNYKRSPLQMRRHLSTA